VADRSAAPARDPGGHAEEAPLRTARHGERRREECNLRGNAARLYNLNINVVQGTLDADQLAGIKRQYATLGAERSNLRYGYVARA